MVACYDMGRDIPLNMSIQGRESVSLKEFCGTSHKITVIM